MKQTLALITLTALCACAGHIKHKDPDMKPLTVKEGTVEFRGMKTWYKIVGENSDPAKMPLVCLHGGPGGTHDYLKPIGNIARTGRQVIFYDQIGNGNSSQPHKPELYTVPFFVDELDNLRAQLGIEQFHLLGQSWGGMLAMEYTLAHPDKVKGLILADSLASTAQWIAEANRLKTELSPAAQEAILKHEAAGTTDSPEYQAAMGEFYKNFVLRLDPWPDYVMASLNQLGQNPEVYFTMWGSSEFNATGTLKNWDIRARLAEITAPTLVLSGKYDESTPLVSGTIHEGIKGSRWVVFERSAHMPHAEETDKYIKTVTDFLDSAEPAR